MGIRTKAQQLTKINYTVFFVKKAISNNNNNKY